MAACPRSFFLKGHSRKVNIHLCCHSACIQPSRPHGTRSFLLCFLFFFLYICALPVCGPWPHQLDWCVIPMAAPGYGEGGVFRELQDPPWLLPAVPWYCKREETECCFIHRGPPEIQGPSPKQVLGWKMAAPAALEYQREPKHVEPLYSKTPGKQENRNLFDWTYWLLLLHP